LAALFDEFDKIIAAEILRGILSAWPAAKGEVFQSALQQVLVRDFGNGAVIQTDKRHGAIRKCATDVDGRDAGCDDGICHSLAIDAAENAIPLPMLEPGWGGFV
jgi:hypothetical protein